jgi:hypothetical protein
MKGQSDSIEESPANDNGPVVPIPDFRDVPLLFLRRWSDTRGPPPSTVERSTMETQARHYLGVEMNQQVWALLGQGRDDKDARRIEHFALASHIGSLSEKGPRTSR